MKLSTLKNWRKQLVALSIVALSLQTTYAQFTPGEGGALPTFPVFTEVPNKVAGLLIDQSDREYSYNQYTRPVVDMSFPIPATIGASTYTLQYSVDGVNWSNYQYNGNDVTTDYNNFSLTLDANYYLRYLVNGGPKNGYTSNEVQITLANVDTYFGGWSLDESMTITSVMSPWIGRGLQAEFTPKKLSDNTAVTGGLTYQWYRVNPMTYEMTLIPLATSLKYTTTIEDAGYSLICKATGDEVNVGGYIQIHSQSENLIQNNSFTNNVSKTGFTLNLYKSVSGLAVEDLTLRDKNYDSVAITGVAQGENAAIYNIAAALDTAKAPYRLENNSRFWKIASLFMMQDYMQGVTINYDEETGIKTVSDNEIVVFPLPTNDVLNIQGIAKIRNVALLNLCGQVLLQSDVNSANAELNTSTISNGLYLLRFTTNDGSIIKKIEIKR